MSSPYPSPLSEEGISAIRVADFQIAPPPGRNERAIPWLDAPIAGKHQLLETSLEGIAHAIRTLTEASGSAIALSTNGEMVCRARAGEIAPDLGARVNASTGISGACLRTGKIQHCRDAENDDRVDLEVCRHLGLRSILVLPISGKDGTNGILEVFSSKPQAFTDEHIALLRQFTALVERTISSRPPARVVASEALVEPPPAAPVHRVPAADDHLARFRFIAPLEATGDVALPFFGRWRRTLLLGGAALLAVLLIGFVIWLGWHTPDRDEETRSARATPERSAQSPISSTNVSPQGIAGLPMLAKRSAGTPVKLAAKIDVVSDRKTKIENISSDDGGDIIVRYPVDTPEPAETVAPEPPPAVTAAAGPSPLGGILSPANSMPGLAPSAISKGLSAGRLLRRVAPVYPQAAREARLQGKVVLQALIAEDGTARNVRPVEGQPVLARAALDAVRQWRYKPYELDGKPVKMNVTITVEFALP